MDSENNKSKDLHLLIVFSPYLSYCESVCFFTDYERAIVEKSKLQEKIDIYQIKQKEYWKDRVIYTHEFPEYDNPQATVITIKSNDIDVINPLYKDIIENYHITIPLDETPSTGNGCWFDFLKEQKKEFSNRIGETNQAMYLVVDFMLKENFKNSQVVGVFRNPETAYNIQSKVLLSYGMDVVFSTIDDKHYVSLHGYIDDKAIDPEEPYYKWC